MVATVRLISISKAGGGTKDFIASGINLPEFVATPQYGDLIGFFPNQPIGAADAVIYR